MGRGASGRPWQVWHADGREASRRRGADFARSGRHTAVCYRPGILPRHQDNPVGATFERINKYVFTHSGAPLEWANSHRLSGDTAEAVAELKRSEGRDLLIQGSSTLYMPLLAAGLIDRLVIMTFPVILGGGKSIFDGPPASGALKLTDHAVSEKGVIFAIYEPAGEVPIGSFADADSSPEQIEQGRRLTEAGE